MKKLLVIFLIFSTAQCLKAQQYQPFDLNSGIWYCFYSTKGGMFGGGTPVNYYASDSVKFYCDGDTIINAVAFKKLMYAGNTSSQVVPLTPISGYYGAIRNDVPNKKVYFVSKGYDSSYQGTGDLLYDFDLNIGDSIATHFISTDKEPVSQIDSVLYCGAYHKRYSSPSGYFIIEGIGSQHGLIPVKFATNFGYTMCYEETGNQSCTNCNIALSLEDNTLNRLAIFPNPTTGSIQIQSDLDILYLELYDADGSLVERINDSKTGIDLKRSGVYLLKIHTDSGEFVRRLIRE
ncbi:T9SS type A sorting domain-containing protein [uncultured Fluviicola sp.]|uniref:T9SS type A sorting domain-containing protein n=1 Tax=uncultured Fluviicola sp. TaxID=463303 RepID=UPI0025E682DA|nr:T9SS type A sorting domain-containing protein [uncultured Fluviicola sp.]